ncbi:hypothetical protein EV715DRAFT_295608 [Schizophyllum commune]
MLAGVRDRYRRRLYGEKYGFPELTVAIFCRPFRAFTELPDPICSARTTFSFTDQGHVDARPSRADLTACVRAWLALNSIGENRRCRPAAPTMVALGAFAGACTHLWSIVLSFDVNMDVVFSPSLSNSIVAHLNVVDSTRPTRLA